METRSEESAIGNRIRLKDGINLNDLISGKPTTFEVNFNDVCNEESDNYSYSPDDLTAYLDEISIEDEDVYQVGQPFEYVEQKSHNLTEDGKIKKRVLRKGYGSKPPDLSQVTIQYNAYIEYQDEPFDSTYARRKPFTFRVNNGEVIWGLDIAVQSMQINERSQFLVHPDYGYGKMGCLERIPPNSTILYEIEFIKFLDTGATITYEHLDEENKKSFEEVYKLAHALCAKGNDLFSKGLYKAAVKEYNTAVSKLEYCVLSDYEGQKKQQELLLRLYSNLVVTYTKINEPRKACARANIIYNMCKDTSLKVPVKVYFNNARSLIMLSQFDCALRKLKDAQKIEPQNPEIAKEFKKLEKLKKEQYNRDVALAKAMFKNNEINQELNEKVNVTNEFKQSFREFCEDLKRNIGVLQYNLPNDLTEEEIKYIEVEAQQQFGFEVRCFEKNGSKNYYLIKSSDLVNK